MLKEYQERIKRAEVCATVYSYPWIDLLSYCIQGFEKTKKWKNILKQKHLVFLVKLVGESFPFPLCKWRQIYKYFTINCFTMEMNCFTEKISNVLEKKKVRTFLTCYLNKIDIIQYNSVIMSPFGTVQICIALSVIPNYYIYNNSNGNQYAFKMTQ